MNESWPNFYSQNMTEVVVFGFGDQPRRAHQPLREFLCHGVVAYYFGNLATTQFSQILGCTQCDQMPRLVFQNLAIRQQKIAQKHQSC